GTGAIARAAGIAELLARDHVIALLHGDPGEMRVQRLEAVAEVDQHHLAVTLVVRHVADRLDDAGRGCGDVQRAQRADVDAGMPLTTGAVVPEAPRDGAARGPLEGQPLAAVSMRRRRGHERKRTNPGGDEP